VEVSTSGWKKAFKRFREGLHPRVRELISSRGVVRILRVLSRYKYATATFLRERTGMGSHLPSAMKRLVECGVVTETLFWNRKVYALNPKYPWISELKQAMETVPNILVTVRTASTPETEEQDFTFLEKIPPHIVWRSRLSTRILQALSEGAMGITKLIRILGSRPEEVRKRIAELRELGLVEETRTKYTRRIALTKTAEKLVSMASELPEPKFRNVQEERVEEVDKVKVEEVTEEQVTLESVFSSKGRIKVIKVLLEEEELNISEITKRAGLSHYVTDRHLEFLVAAGLVREKKFGRIRIFQLRAENSKVQLLRSLFEAW